MNSNQNKNLILVDDNNEPIGFGEKLDVHQKGALHKAFSLFIYDPINKKFLIQKRALGKYHSGGKWSNTCCSHPYKDEDERAMLDRGMKDELNYTGNYKIKALDSISSPNLKELDDTILYLDQFKYFSDYGEMKEHEIDSVYLYVLSNIEGVDQDFNPEEISELNWLTIEEIDKELEQDPKNFSTWFPKAYAIVKNALSKINE